MIHLRKLGPTLQKLRERSGLTPEQVCNKLQPFGVRSSPTKVSEWESGRSVPALAPLIAYLEAVGSSLQEMEQAMIAADAVWRPRPSEPSDESTVVKR